MTPSSLDAETLGLVLATLPGVVLLIDEDRRIRYMNRGAAGNTPETFIGMDAFDVLAPENRVAAVEAVDRALESGEPTTHVAQVLRPDGGAAWFESTVIPLEVPGRGTCTVISSSDVTARVEAEQELAMVQALLPLCSWCRKIRTDDGAWATLEDYLEEMSDSRVTHGMCPDCEGRIGNGDDRRSA